MCELSFSLTFSPRALGNKVFFGVTFMALHYLAITAFWCSGVRTSVIGRGGIVFSKSRNSLTRQGSAVQWVESNFFRAL